jgi:hypothetical protein
MDLTAFFPASEDKSCPLILTTPLEGFTIPARMRMRVVLPAPLGPNNPNMPDLILRSMPFSAWTERKPLPYVLDKFTISIMVFSFFLVFIQDQYFQI